MIQVPRSWNYKLSTEYLVLSTVDPRSNGIFTRRRSNIKEREFFYSEKVMEWAEENLKNTVRHGDITPLA